MSLFEEGVYVFRLKGERHVQPFFIETIYFSRFLCTSLSILAVQAAEPASLAGQAHREVHTTTVTQTESHSSTRESASDSGWSVSRPSSLGMLSFRRWPGICCRQGWRRFLHRSKRNTMPIIRMVSWLRSRTVQISGA